MTLGLIQLSVKAGGKHQNGNKKKGKANGDKKKKKGTLFREG